MKSKVVIALLFLGLLGLAAVRADDGDEGSGGAGSGGEAPAPKPKAGKAGKAGKKGKDALPAGEFNPEGLPPVPVKPLSTDAAALSDDDELFAKFEPKTVTGKENVAELTQALAKAQSFLKKMRRDLEGEKVWTKNVYDIIQNYQYKYLKTIKDVRLREKKVAKMAQLVQLIKQSALHAGVKRELQRASEALEELVTRAPEGNGGAMYRKIASKMAKLKKALALMPRAEHLFTDTSEKVKDILSSDVSPDTGDALRELVAAPAAAAAPKLAAVKAAKKVTAKAKAAKPAKAAKKPAAKPKKAAAKKPAPKPKKAAPKKKPAPKPVKKAAEEEEDE